MGITQSGAKPSSPASLHYISPSSNTAKLAAYANGLVLDLDARTLTTSNTAAVTAWVDMSGAGNPVTGGSAIMNTTSWSDGGPCVAWAGGEYEATNTLGSLVTSGAAHSVAVQCRRGALGSYHTLFGLGGVNSPYKPLFQYFVSDANVVGAQIIGASTSAILATTVPMASTSEDVTALFSWSGVGKQLTIYVNGQAGTLDFSAVSSFGAGGYAFLGAYYNGGPATTFVGKIRRAAAWSRALGAADWRALVARWGAAYCHRYGVVIAGNSINAGYDGIGENNPLQSYLYLPAQAIVTNTATDGWTSEQVLADVTTTVAPLVSAQPTLPWIYVVDEIRNSINAGDGATTATNKIFAACSAARALGMFPVLGTPLDCGQWTGGNDAYKTAQLASALTILRNGWAGYADALVDLNAIPQLSSASNSTYYNGDKIHPTQAGQRVRGSAYAPAIQALAQTAIDALVLTP